MNLGMAFVVVIPNKESEERLLSILKRREQNYPVIMPSHWPSKEYPISYLISSKDGTLVTLPPGGNFSEVSDLGLSMWSATNADLEAFGLLGKV